MSKIFISLCSGECKETEPNKSAHNTFRKKERETILILETDFPAKRKGSKKCIFKLQMFSMRAGHIFLRIEEKNKQKYSFCLKFSFLLQSTQIEY
jgi:hypothetical protein